MSKYQPNDAEVVDTCSTRLKALKSYVANTKAVIAIDGVPNKAADVVAIYQDCLDARATLDTQRASVKASLVVRTTAESSSPARRRSSCRSGSKGPSCASR